jgi:serine/threonine protein kinase
VEELINDGATEEEIQKEFNIEVDIMINLQNSLSIMSLKGLFSQEGEYKMVMELMTEGSLVNYLNNGYHKATREKQ